MKSFFFLLDMGSSGGTAKVGAVARYTQQWTAGSPFRGDRAFDLDHADIFFGRGQAIEDSISCLRKNHKQGKAFLLVSGVSGVGKTSLVQAGILPSLFRSSEEDGLGIIRNSILSLEAGEERIFLKLAHALCGSSALPELVQDGTAVSNIGEMLCETPKSAGILIKGALSLAAQEKAFKGSLSRPPKARLILVVDPLESLFAEPGIPVEDRVSFFMALQSLAKSGLVWIIATLRADQLDRCTQEHEFASLLNGLERFRLRRPEVPELCQMIRQPALAAGLSFEQNDDTGMTLDGVIRDVVKDFPESLALLENFLNELYETRSKDGVLTFNGYSKIGGYEKSVLKRADKAYDALSNGERAVFDKVFRQLISITLGEGEEVVRRFASYREVANTPETKSFVDLFVDHRLFVAGAKGEEPGVIIAHDYLINDWPKFQEFLDRNKADLIRRARFGVNELLWRDAGCADDFLLLGDKVLDDAEACLLEKKDELLLGEEEYISSSLKAREARLQEVSVAEKKQKLIYGGVAGAFIVVLFLWLLGSLGKSDEMDNLQGEIIEIREEVDTAESKRALSEDFLHALIRYIHRRSEGRGELDIFRGLAERGIGYLNGAELKTGASDTVFVYALGLHAFGKSFSADGDADPGLTYLREAETLLGNKPDGMDGSLSGEWDYELSAVKRNIGRRLFGNGEISGGIELFQAGLKLLTSLKGSNLAGVDLEAELFRDYWFLGEQQFGSGDHEGAFTSFGAWVDLWDGSLARWQGYDKIGQHFFEEGQLNFSLRAYKEMASLLKGIGSSISNEERNRMHGEVNRKIAKAYEMKGNFTEALEAYENELSYLRKGSNRERGQVQGADLLGICLNDLGSLYFRVGRSSDAAKAFGEAVRINEDRNKEAPSDLGSVVELARSYQGIGDVEYGKKNYSSGLNNFKKSVVLWETVIGRVENASESRSQYAIAKFQTGAGYLQQRNYKAAEVEIIAGLAQLEQGNTLGGRLLDAYVNLSESQLQLKKYEEAYASLKKEFSLRNQGNAGDALDLQNMYERFIAALEALNRRGEALPFYQKRIPYLEEQLKSKPKDRGLLAELSSIYKSVGQAFIVSDDLAKGEVYLKKYLALRGDGNGGSSGSSEESIAIADIYQQVGDIYKGKHDARKALDYYGKAIVVLTPMVQSKKVSKGETFKLGELLSKVGDLWLDVDDYDKAENAYSDCLKILEEVVPSSEKNFEWQRLLLQSYNRFGEILQGRGDHKAARGFLERGLGRVERLTKDSTHGSDAMYLKALLLTNVGKTYLGSNDANTALRESDKALALIEQNLKTVSNDDVNLKWRRQKGTVHKLLGEVYAMRKDQAKSVFHFNEEVKIYQDLVRLYPNDGDVRLGFSEAYLNVGDGLIRGGKLTEGIGAYRKSINVAENLLSSGIGNSGEVGRILASTYKALGDVQKGGDALSSYKRALAVGDLQFKRDPSDKRWVIFLSRVNASLGSLYAAERRMPEAIQAYEESYNLASRLEKDGAGSGPTVMIDELIRLKKQTGNLYFQQKDNGKALDASKTWLSLIEKLPASALRDLKWKREKYLALTRIAEIYVAFRDYNNGLKYFSRAYDEQKGIVDRNPNDAQLRWNLAGAGNQLGILLLDMKRNEEALVYLNKSVEMLERLSRTNSKEPQIRIDLVGTYINTMSAYDLTKKRERDLVVKLFNKAGEYLKKLQVETGLNVNQRKSVNSLLETHRRFYAKFQ